MIEIIGVHKRLGGRPVLEGVDLDVREGEMLVIMGPSGTGKSVLLKHIVGLFDPDAGDIIVDGISVPSSSREEIAAIRAKIAYVFQNSALFDSMTVRGNLLMGLPPGSYQDRMAECEELARTALNYVNLAPDVLALYPAELSGGMQRRVAIARAIIGKRRYVLYDEPTTGLDPVNATRINRLIAHVSREVDRHQHRRHARRGVRLFPRRPDRPPVRGRDPGGGYARGTAGHGQPGRAPVPRRGPRGRSARRMRDPGLRDRGVEIRVGIFLILAAIVSVAGLFWIADSPFRGPTIRVWGVVGDAGQITPDSPVLLRGVEIGTVDEVGLETERAVIGMTISTRIPLPADTRGTVRPSGFLGQQLIELMPGAGMRALAEGDTISLDRASDLVSLASSFGEETGGLIERLESILTEQFAENVAAGSEALTLVMRELAGLLEAERSSIGGMLANMDTLSGRLSGLTGSEEVDRTLASLDTLSSRLAGASDDFAATGRSLAEITRRLEAGEGTLGKLLGEDDVYDGLLETLETLRAAGEEFGLLMRDIRERPDRYLEDIKISVF